MTSKISTLTWSLETGALRLGLFLRLSFQRFPLSADVVPPGGLPRSWGALPIGMGEDGSVAVPLGEAEAVWLGLSTTRRSVAVAVRVAAMAETEIDAVTGAPWDTDDLCERPRNYLVVSPTSALYGVPIEGGTAPFRRRGKMPGLRVLAVPARVDAANAEPGPWQAMRLATARIRYLSYQSFERETGLPRPSPLDPCAPYAGWRLP